MKGIPAHFIIKNENIPDLDQMYRNGLVDDEVAELRIEFTKFLTSSFSTFVGPKSIRKDEIEESYFLRLIVDKIFTQANRSQRVEAEVVDMPDFDISAKAFLFELFLKEHPFKSNRDTVPKLRLDKLPSDWKKISNNRKESYLIGGPNPDFTSWKALSLHRVPVSSFIIVDPYFLERWEETELNLSSMFQGLIDPKLGLKNFELIIAVRYDKRKSLPNKSVQESQLDLEKFLKDQFPKFEFSLSIVYVNKAYTHDRYLFSDFYYLKSGGGFNFYNSKRKFNNLKTNDLDIRMLSNEKDYQAYKKRLLLVYEWINSKDSLYGAEGKLKSRLFDSLKNFE